MTRGSTVRRVVLVLVGYGLAAWIALPLLDAFARALLLPASFGSIARGALWAGALVATAVALRYPDVGGGPG